MAIKTISIQSKLFVKIITAVFSILIISVVLAIIINPIEFVRFQRDRQRKEDLKKLSLVIRQAEAEQKVQARKKTVYVSLPDDSPDCADWKSKGLPTLGGGFKYNCVARGNLRNIDGSGWLPINLTVLAASPFDRLPIDPMNGKRGQDSETEEETLFFYQYINGSFVLGAFSELSPDIDEAYSSAKNQIISKALTGFVPIEVGAAAGGQMIFIGSLDLLHEANAPWLSAEALRTNKKAAQDAFEEIERLGIKQPAPALPEPTPPALKKPEPALPKPVVKKEEVKEPEVSPTGPACVKIIGSDKPVAICGREKDCLAGNYGCGVDANCSVCVILGE